MGCLLELSAENTEGRSFILHQLSSVFACSRVISPIFLGFASKLSRFPSLYKDPEAEKKKKNRCTLQHIWDETWLQNESELTPATNPSLPGPVSKVFWGDGTWGTKNICHGVWRAWSRYSPQRNGPMSRSWRTWLLRTFTFELLLDTTWRRVEHNLHAHP